MSEHQPSDPQQMPEAQPAAVAAPGVSRIRRNLLRAGALGAPALVALKPAPAIACNCKLPSGFTVSGNASRKLYNCQDPADKPLTWKGRYKRVSGKDCYYKGAYTLNIHRGTKVTSLGFICGSYGNDTTTVNAWLDGELTPTGLIMACYLEAAVAGNDTTFPQKQKFVDMWNNAVVNTTGYTVANQVKKWDKDQVIGYLKFLTAQGA